MTAFVPPLAPIVVLAFLGTAFLLAVAAATILYATLSGKRRLILHTMYAAAALIGIYGALLLTASALSKEQVLHAGGKKYFCEIDCHLAYSVEKVETASDLGVPPGAVRAAGQFQVVTLRAWFDEATISSRRGRDLPLYPNPRIVYVRDAAGRTYQPSALGQEALAAMGRVSTPITTPLRPGESYEIYLVFDLPRDARDPRLFLGNAPGVEFVLIGHEMSPWHKKVWFSLQ